MAHVREVACRASMKFNSHEFHVLWGRASVIFDPVLTDIHGSAHMRTHTYTHTHTHIIPAHSLYFIAHYHAILCK